MFPRLILMVLETLGLQEPAQVCVTSLSQMCLSAGPSPIPIPIQSYSALEWTLVMRKGGRGHPERKGPFLLFPALFSTGLSTAMSSILPAPSSSSRKQMGKALGRGKKGGAGLLGHSCWVAVPVCFFLLLIPWEQAGVEPWRRGCLADLLQALAHL